MVHDILAGILFGTIFLLPFALLELSGLQRDEPADEIEPWDLYIERIIEGESK